jgi:hypothetical protein
MLRICLLASALCTVLGVPPAVADEGTILPGKAQRADVMAPASGLPTAAWTCRAAAVAQEPEDESIRWRWRAYRHLDCVIEMVEALAARADGGSGTVSLSRDELERIRAMALQAKDAAARIAR